MSHIFISYSRRDTATVDKIVERLEKAGIDVWIDREGIHAGRQWRIQIVEAIDTAKAFVLNVSESSVASVNVLKELNLAEDAVEPFVLPFLLEEVKIPAEMRYQLAGVQQIFYYIDPEKAYDELERTLQERLGIEREEKQSERREIEIVIKGEKVDDFDEEKKQQLLALLAESAGVSVEQLAVTRIELGSIHVFVEAPRQTGYALKTLALNKDQRLVAGGITKLRFAGDKHFVPLDELSIPAEKGISKAVRWGLVGLLLVTFAVGGILLQKRGGGVSHPVTKEALPSNTPIPVVSATATSTRVPTKTSIPTITPTATETSLPTPIVEFWVEPEQIEAGQCAALEWRVENAEKVFFGNTEMSLEDRYSDCFCNTNIYTLTVIDLYGQESKYRQTVNVVGACATPTPPVLPG